MSSKTTDHLVYVYHRASIACKVDKVEVPTDGFYFELCCIDINLIMTGKTWREGYEVQDDIEF